MRRSVGPLSSRSALFRLALGALLSTAGCAGPRPTVRPPPPPAQVEPDVEAWVTYYYRNPQPEVLPAVLEKLAARGDFENEDVYGPTVAFLSRIFQSHPERLPGWGTLPERYPTAARRALFEALWLADSEPCRKLLTSWAERYGAELKAWAQKLRGMDPPNLLTLPLDAPEILDLLWASFMATGDPRYVERLLTVLEWTEADLDGGLAEIPDAFQVRTAAEWSVGSNIRQHELVRRICEERALDAGWAGSEALKRLLSP